ncbi:MAG: SRPBCC domain-containing protein [Planctomycetes bacterium]|nr:SRPBCC domain-containing protein [Planctomycetota bacterium]
MITREDDGVWVELEETISIHHDQTFTALTTVGGLTRWFCVSATVDLRQGGLIVFGWDPEMTRTSTVAILEYDPGGRIVWDWYANHGDMHAPVYWAVEPSVEDGSRVRLRQGPFKDDGEALMVMANEAQMWRWYLCNMRSCFEAKLDMRKVKPL